MIETKIIVKPKGNSGTGNSSGASGYGGEYVPEADYAARAGKAKKAESADLAMRANTANTADRAKYADKAGELDEEAEVLQRYIRKDIDDIAQGTVTWEKVQKLLSGLLVGNFNNENGGSWTPDTEGRSHLITDYLEVRMKAIFEELVIKKTSTIGGKEIISPAGGVVAHKVENVTVTYNEVSQKAYRCYFLAEQEGDSVDNDFSVNDQVRSESFNVRKGTYHKVGNHFYWRLVIGRDEDLVELEGKKYHYIDLSDTDCATASDVPAKGDVLSQCGNRTDVERQNCLIFSAVDTYSPSVSLYHGINSYSFANREYVEYGVNKQTNKAFFNVYGDMYVGDRPTKENNYEGSSYIKYDSATKQVSVKGKISAKSTVDGKELSQYIKENSAKGLTEEQVNNLIKNSQVITDLQNQVDGAIETWFYEGVPTLKNAPASSWTTDKDKDTHLGDLYYDNKTGKAYRFAKDGNTYKWTIIADTDIAKALSDASNAQETADGKMKVFSTQPTPPYQVGDIWVNATYPADGSIYKNEVLRCQTLKAAGSPFAIADWIKASKYTDDTVANAAKKAAEEAQKAAQTAQTNITNLGKTVTGNKKAFDNYVTDGYLEPSEIAAMAQDSKRLEDDFAAAQKSYNEVKDAEVLKDTKELTDLNTAFATLTTAKKELIEYLSDISARYNAADTKGKATIVSAVGTKFTNFQSAYSAFYDKLGLANAYITSKIYGDLGVVIGDVTSLAYLKKALMDTPDTEINGGLVLTSLIGLRDTDGNTTAGINGITEKSAKGGGVAAWFGGEMVDKDYNDGSKTPANTIFRFDGSGYVAGGAIWWGTDGRVHADPTSFIISEKNLGAYLTFFEPTWKSGSAGTSVADLVSLKPNAPFSKLGVSGDATFEGAITFHGISITYDATNKAIKVDGNLYATGGITAYGASSVAGGGGGLNGSVKAYADATRLTTENLSEIASAYSVAKLYSEIQNVASAVPSISVSVPTGGNALTGATYDASTGVITFAKGTFLTAHQSLDGYVNAIAVSGSGNAVTAVTKSGKTITFTKGATYLTSHQSLAAYLKSADAASTYAVVGHTHKVKINGAEKTINPSTGTIVDLGTYLTSHQSLAAYMKTTDANNTFSKIGHTHGYASSVKLGQTSYSASNNVISLPAYPTALKSPTAITIQTNGTSLGSYDGSTAKTFNLTYANVGAASAGHNHDSVYSKLHHTHPYLPLSGGTLTGGLTVNSNVTSSGIGTFKVLRVGSVDIKVDDSGNLYIINKDGKTAANFYATGGISAYGASDGTSSGGGLNGSVKSYADALKLASESLSEIASAYSIKALDSRIVSLEGGSAMDVSVSGSGNAVTAISKSGTTISVTKGITFLTSHQSLDGYVNEVATSGTGNAITSVSKSGKKLTFTKGATFLTSHQSLSAYLKSADAANTYSKLGHTHSQYLTSHQSFTDLCATLDVGDGVVVNDTEFVTSIADANGFSNTSALNRPYKRKASKLWEYIKNKANSLYQPIGDYATQSWVNNKGYITSSSSISGNAATATNADKVDGYHAYQLFRDLGWWNSSETHNANDIEGNASVFAYSTHSNVPTTGVLTTFSGGNGAYNWQMIKQYNWRSLYIRYRNGDTKTWSDWVRLLDETDLTWSSISNKPTNVSQFTNDSGYITSSANISGNAGSATKLQTSRNLWGNSFNGTENIGGTILPSATHRYNLGSTTYMFERTYTRYIETDDGYDLRVICAGNELIRLGSTDNVVYFNSQGLSIKNDVSSGCSMSISEIRDSELNYGQINVIDTNGSRPKGRHLVLQYEQGNVGIGVKYPSEKLEINGNVLVNVSNTSSDRGLKIKANSRNLLFGVGSSTKIGVYSYSDSKWLFYTDTSTFYTSGGILATGGITAYSSSDIRLKQDLRKLDYLGIIKAMGGTFGFAWKKDNTRSIGFIAQHVLCNPHLKDIVETDENGYYKINYWSPKLIATAFGAIEQVGDEVSRLKARVVFLESEVQRLSGKQDGNNKKRLDNKNINLSN